MKTIVPFCLLMLITSGECGRRYGTSPRPTTWWPRATTWWPQQTTWAQQQQTTWLPGTRQPTPGRTTRRSRISTGRPTTRRQKSTDPGGQIIRGGVCPDGLFYCRKVWNGRCFPEIYRSAKSWPMAEDACVHRGRGYIIGPKYIGHLASFHNQEQFDFLMNLVGSGNFWIGLNERYKNHWTFSDGSPLNFVPANSVLRTGISAFVDPTSRRLVSDHAGAHRGYICQLCLHDKHWPTNSIPHVVDKTNRRVCEHGVCYKYEHPSGTKPFYEAEHYCASAYRGHLAAFHSREQFDFLVEESRKYPAMWIGAHSGNGEQWMFTDGSPMNYVPEESGLDGRPNPGCAALERRVLEDQNCIGRWDYICMYPD